MSASYPAKWTDQKMVEAQCGLIKHSKVRNKKLELKSAFNCWIQYFKGKFIAITTRFVVGGIIPDNTLCNKCRIIICN